MRFGRLKDRIEIIQETRTSDGMGGYTKVWSIYKTVWGEFRPKLGKEIIAADQNQNPIEAMIRIRYTTGITEAMRIRYKGTVYEIIGGIINVNNANKELEINVAEVTP